MDIKWKHKSCIGNNLLLNVWPTMFLNLKRETNLVCKATKTVDVVNILQIQFSRSHTHEIGIYNWKVKKKPFKVLSVTKDHWNQFRESGLYSGHNLMHTKTTNRHPNNLFKGVADERSPSSTPISYEVDRRQDWYQGQPQLFQFQK